jgi:FxsC-like protein
VLAVAPGLVDPIRQAEAANEVVLIVVDPWTVRIKSYRDPLQAYDEQNFINCELLVPWNGADAETAASVADLRYSLRQSFQRTYVLNRSHLQDNITSREEFERA